MSDLSREFTCVVKGNNFITPRLEGYYPLKNGVAELSSGSGIFTDTIWGVTVVWNGVNDHDKSKGGFYTKKEALDYIETMQ